MTGLHFEDILTLQKSLELGEITSKQLTTFFLERIAKYDKTGPKINSILELNPEALHIAEALDKERTASGPRGPLHGIPIIVKDNIDTADKMHTSAGSLALANNYASTDSFVAKKLREAGAIILGKANMTEWANFMTEGMPNGYSSRGGQVLNPYNPGELDVGGSSSGSAASIATGLAVAAIGTETSGSILSPASSNSLVGIKPTVGLISRSGIVPISNSQDTAGPIAKTVTDAAIVLGALTGIDANDPATAMSEASAQKDYTKHLTTKGLHGKKIGVVRDYFSEIDEAEVTIFEAALKELEAEGATIVEHIDYASEVTDIEVMIHEFKSTLNAYLAPLSAQVPVHSLSEVILFNEAHKDVTLKYGQTLLSASEKTSGTLTEAAYINARLNDLKISQSEGIDQAIKQYDLDALVFINNYGAGIPAKAGYPSITVPAGYTEQGKPVGITWTGLAFSEAKLIEMAYAYEQVTKHRRAPQLD
ncbi:amidase family protein [Radiobacillus sp. PE A8.2]|uniref:amidase family protein n=1 Tax=Radiobacillus sp. PE A8.2 TaxID=3380349 RepID=UPI003890AF68